MSDTKKTQLEDALKAYASSDMYPFHMPGHKGQRNPVHRIDITEIDGFDSLHDPHGLLLQEMRRAASFYRTRNTYFLVNGSTVGLLTAISAAVPFGGTILIERSCHIAVYHAAYIRRLRVRFTDELPGGQAGAGSGCGKGSSDGRTGAGSDRGKGSSDGRTNFGFSAGSSGEHVDAVVITSPSYDGQVQDVSAWASYAHALGIPLIVDEAHGAHFSMHPYFPESAVRLGADLVIQSTHKTLPAMTQTALLHNVTGRVDSRLLERFLDIYETSSPSYVLMASITSALHAVMDGGPAYFDDYAARLRHLRAELKNLRHLSLDDGPGRDPGKLVIRARGTQLAAPIREDGDDPCGTPQGTPLSGPLLYDILRLRYHLQPEMKTPDYVLLMTSVADTEEGFARLAAALKDLDGKLEEAAPMAAGGPARDTDRGPAALPPRAMEIYEAYEASSEIVSFENAAGRISADFIIVYPPDAPVLVPGEVCTKEVLKEIWHLQDAGLTVTGIDSGVRVVLSTEDTPLPL